MMSRLFSYYRHYLFSNGFLGFLAEGAESLGVGDGHFAKHLAVDFDVGFVKSIDQTAIRDVIGLSGGAYSPDPEFAHIPLQGPTGNISVFPAVEDLLFGGLEKQMLAAEITLGMLQHLLATLTGNGSTFNSHLWFLLTYSSCRSSGGCGAYHFHG